MSTILSLLVCLASQPVVCETVLVDMMHVDGTPITFHECLGAPGQDMARRWLLDHPQYELQKIRCSVSNDAQKLREQLVSPQA